MNNQLRSADPDGMEADVYINGVNADRANLELQKEMSNIKIARDGVHLFTGAFEASMPFSA